MIQSKLIRENKYRKVYCTIGRNKEPILDSKRIVKKKPCYSKQELLDDIRRVTSEYRSTRLDIYKKYGRFSTYAFYHQFNCGWKGMLEKIGLKATMSTAITKEELVKDVLDVFEQTKSTKQENYIKNGKYSRAIINRIFGSWNKMLFSLGIQVNMFKPGQYSKESIIQDYKKISIEKGRPLSCIEFRNLGKYSQPIIDRVFGSFSNLKRELHEYVDARFVSDEEVRENLIALSKKYGDILSREIILNEGIVSYPTFVSRFGSMRSFCEENGIRYDSNESKLFISCMSIIRTIWPDKKYKKEKTFSWLINPLTNHPLFIDAYYPTEKIAIEIDGPQHYKFTPLFHGTVENFKEAQFRDKVKDELLKKHGIQVIRILHPDVKEIRTKLSSIKVQ